MKAPKKFLCWLMLVASWGSAFAAAPPAVTFESLLREMTNRCAAAEWPMSAYTCAQVSSHDPHKTNPADPSGWHANVDYGNCLRVETNANRREWPGAGIARLIQRGVSVRTGRSLPEVRNAPRRM